ncbi:hypothetical protein DRO56_00330 [Candidatus Bathyarchaeota archaeon]|nr:MAG: hypothetical protein DRO56_00330 [Candidatus Bathyarchaeota archaeon]
MFDLRGGRGAASLCLLLILVILTLWPAYPGEASDEGLVTLSGRVIDFETQRPIENATVSVWEGQVLIAQGNTNSLGIFGLRVPEGHNYRVYAYMDIPNTTGWDYLPAFREIFSPTGDVNLTMELRPGASVIIDNDIQFVDTTSPINAYTYEVIDPETGETLNIEGYELIYGTLEEARGHFLNLNASHLIVPADISFNIRVNASALVKGRYILRSFLIDEPGHLRLPRGGLMHLDVRKYSLQYNLEMMDGEVAKTKAKIDEMDKLGFYLTLEKQRLVRVSGVMESVRFDLLRGDYVNGFKELRKAYIELTDLYASLTGTYRSAATSVYILIFFLAFTSTTISFLFFEKLWHKTAASGGLTAVTHLLLHEIYPGAAYISARSFSTFSLLAWCSSLLVTIVVPHFMKGRAVAGRTPLRNIIVPIFSLAKRSLTRRRLRFVLTLSSVTILVMSFVTLTSFTMGYGLILRRISRQIVPVDGVLVRAPHGEYSETWSTFTPLDAASVEWLMKHGEVEVVAPKAENLPTLIPLLTLNGRPIYGILGILPSAEAKILGLDRLVEEGRYLLDGEENAILISDRLKEDLGVEVNATLRLGGLNVAVVGVVSGEGIKGLRDLDGSYVIPNKLVDLSAPDEPPDIHPLPVEVDEFVICDLETALRMPGVFLSRIDATLRTGESINDFAERVALERNYNVWASSEEGLYIARLGTYFQAKGLPLAVPWAIVVLNVVITMLNSLYERRREISILSSVGLNPSHIAGIFIAEAIAIGLIGGGVGYLLGLGMYKVMTLLHIALEVRQKVSALWCLGALGIAMTAVIIGALSALKGSVIITPSLMRRWRIRGREEFGKPIEIDLPISVPSDEIDDFMDYLLRNLRRYEDDPVARTERFKVWREDTEERSVRGIKFIYRTVGAAFADYSTNRIVAERRSGEEFYTVKLYSLGERRWVHQTGSLVRLIIMRWSTRK